MVGLSLNATQFDNVLETVDMHGEPVRIVTGAILWCPAARSSTDVVRRLSISIIYAGC